MISDADLPAVERLLGPEADAVLAAAVTHRRGRIQAATPTFVDYVPGRRLGVRYLARVEWPDGTREETLAASLGRGEAPPGATLVDAAGSSVAVWHYPVDPWLPGLEQAWDVNFVGSLLDELGLPAHEITLASRAYTPGGRAVVEVAAAAPGNKLVFRPGQGLARAAPRPLLYLKLVRPGRIARMRRTYEALSGRIASPECLAWREELGMVAFGPLAGDTLWAVVRRGAAPPPGADAIMDLLEPIAGAELGPSPRATTTAAVRSNVSLLGALAPGERERLGEFVHRLGEDAPQPEVAIHGDFHEMQILVDGEAITGVLDLDDAGRGQRIDDLAMLAGRFWAFAETASDGGERVRAYARQLIERFGDMTDRRELRRRVAGVAMNQATGPFRFQQPDWPAATVAAIRRADRLLEQLTVEA